MRRACATAALGSVLLLSGCAGATLTTYAQTAPYPAGLVAPTVAGLTSQPEPSARQAFASVGPTSTVHRGKVWSLRRQNVVLASLEVAQLKGGLDTRDFDVRRGIWQTIGNGTYRWFKVDHRQWVGVQQADRLLVYVWFPPRGDLFEVLQVKADQPNPDAILRQILAFQHRQKGL